MIDWAKDESSSFMVPDDMTSDVSVASLKSFVSKVFKAESGSVVGGSLFGVSNPESYVTCIKEVIPNLRILPKAGLSPFLSSILNQLRPQ